MEVHVLMKDTTCARTGYKSTFVVKAYRHLNTAIDAKEKAEKASSYGSYYIRSVELVGSE